MTSTSPIHATSIARFGPGGWQGVLITGRSGAGKSDLALRLLLRGWRLVADDYSLVWRSGDRLYARSPATIADRIEVRGVGIVSVPALTLAPLALWVEAADGPVERLPPTQTRCVLDLSLPLVRLVLTHASAPDVVERALSTLSPASPLP